MQGALISELTPQIKSGPNKGLIIKSAVIAITLAIAGTIFSNSFFYAEPGYIYHIRTVTGSEEVVTDVGYKFYPFGRYNAWKRAMTVQALVGANGNAIRAEKDTNNSSANLPPMSIMFLDLIIKVKKAADMAAFFK